MAEIGQIRQFRTTMSTNFRHKIRYGLPMLSHPEVAAATEGSESPFHAQMQLEISPLRTIPPRPPHRIRHPNALSSLNEVKDLRLLFCGGNRHYFRIAHNSG